MSGNNVKITVHGEVTVSNNGGIGLVVNSPWFSSVIQGFAVAALREYFAAERMPEDVQKLVGEMRRSADSQRRQQPRPGEWAADHGWTARADLLDRAIAALEAAYSQRGAVDEPR